MPRAGNGPTNKAPAPKPGKVSKTFLDDLSHVKNVSKAKQVRVGRQQVINALTAKPPVRQKGEGPRQRSEGPVNVAQRPTTFIDPLTAKGRAEQSKEVQKQQANAIMRAVLRQSEKGDNKLNRQYFGGTDTLRTLNVIKGLGRAERKAIAHEIQYRAPLITHFTTEKPISGGRNFGPNSSLIRPVQKIDPYSGKVVEKGYYQSGKYNKDHNLLSEYAGAILGDAAKGVGYGIHEIGKGLHAATSGAAHGFDSVVQAIANKGIANPTQARQLSKAGVGPDKLPRIKIGEVALNSLLHGLASGGGAVMEGFDRIAGATEAELARELVKNNHLIKGDTARKIMAARTPGQVLKHGRHWGKDVTGQDISQGLFKTKALGLPIDLVVDPTMWVGGALAPETGGASLAVALEKLGRLAPAVEKLPEIQKAIKAAEAVDNVRPLEQALHKLRQPSAFRRAIAPGKHSSITHQINALDSQAAIDRVLGATSTTPRVTYTRFKGKKAKTVVLPDNANEVAAQTRRVAETRRVRAQPRLKIMTPLGHELGGVNLPTRIGKHDLANVKILRKGAEQRKTETRAAEVQAQAAAEKAKADDLAKIDAQILEARKVKDSASVRSLEKERELVAQHYDTQIALSRRAARENIGKLESPADRMSRRQDRHATHSGVQVTGEIGRATESAINHAQQFIFRDLKGTEPERLRQVQRIQLVREARAGSRGVAGKTLEQAIKLTPREEHVLTNLDKLEAQIGQHSLSSDLFDKLKPNYAGQRQWSSDVAEQPAATIHASVSPGTGTNQTMRRHRSVEAFSDFASRGDLASVIHDLQDANAGLRISDATRIAEELHQTGSLERQLLPVIVSEIQRGKIRNFEDYTKVEQDLITQATLHGHATRGDEAAVPMFRSPANLNDNTEGKVLLGPNAEEHYFGTTSGETALNSLLPAERDQAIIAKIDEHAAAIAHAIENTTSDALRGDLEQIQARLRAERQQYASGATHAPQEAIPAPETVHTPDEPAKPAEADVVGDGVPGEGAVYNPPVDHSAVFSEHGRNHDINALTAAHEEAVANYEARVAARTKLKEKLEQVSATAPAKLEKPTDTIIKESENYALVKTANGKYYTWDKHEGEKLGNAEVGSVVGAKAGYQTALHRAEERYNAWAYQDLLPGARKVPNAVAPEKSAYESIRPQADAAVQAAAEKMHAAQAPVDEYHRLASVAAAHENRMAGKIEMPDVPVPPENAKVVDTPEGKFIAGPDNHTPPNPDDMTPPPFIAGAYDDPFNPFGQLADFRSDNEMLNLDARQTGYSRARQEATNTMMRARWAQLDHMGIDSTHADLTRTTALDGKHHYVLDTENGPVNYVSVHEFFNDKLGTAMLDRVPTTRLWPEQAAQQYLWDQAKMGGYDRVYHAAGASGFERVMSNVRFGVTTPFPAYHIRNLVSDAIKSLQADTGVLFHPIVNAKLLAGAMGKTEFMGKSIKFHIPGMEKMDLADFLLIADMYGARSGHHVADVSAYMRDLARETPKGTVRQAVDKVNPLHKGGWTTTFGSRREDIVRYQTFTQRLRANGGDAADATWYMIRHHFDYNDLTQKERTVIRNLFLFYTWYRRNIPLQLVELTRRPGFFAGASTVYHGLASGQTPINQFGPLKGEAPPQPGTPAYVKDSMIAATTNWKGHALNIGYGAPWADLNWLSADRVGEFFRTNANPVGFGLANIAGAFAPGGRGVDQLTGRTYNAYEGAPGGSAVAWLWKELGGKELPKGDDGKPMVPWRLAYILRSIPVFGRASSSFQGTPATRDQGQLQDWGSKLSWLTGLNINVAAKPGSERENLAITKAAKAYGAIRKDYVMSLKTIKLNNKDLYNGLIKKWDEQHQDDAKRTGLYPYLKGARNTGIYNKKPTGSGYGLGGGLGGGGL